MIAIFDGFKPMFEVAHKFIAQVLDVNVCDLALPQQKVPGMLCCRFKPRQRAGGILLADQRPHPVIVLLEQLHKHMFLFKGRRPAPEDVTDILGCNRPAKLKEKMPGFVGLCLDSVQVSIEGLDLLFLPGGSSGGAVPHGRDTFPLKGEVLACTVDGDPEVDVAR